MRLTARQPATPEDVESMRVVRNSCRYFMTHDQSEISQQTQATWWNSLDRSAIRPFVFLLDEQVVGYGILRFSDGKWWCSGGLSPKHRYNGLGTEIFSYLIEKCPSDELWLDVWSTNQHARRLYAKLGFEIVDADYASMPEMAPAVVVMKHKR